MRFFPLKNLQSPAGNNAGSFHFADATELLWKESLCGYTNLAPYNDKEGVLIADDQNRSTE